MKLKVVVTSSTGKPLVTIPFEMTMKLLKRAFKGYNKTAESLKRFEENVKEIVKKKTSTL